MSQIFRRDPRREWILRNRLHPLHAELSQPTGEVRGPSGVIRKNPHAVGFIGPNGLKRIDRMAIHQVSSLARRDAITQADVQLPLITVEDPKRWIVAVLDMAGGRMTSHDKDILGQAHKLAADSEQATAVVAVVFGSSKETAFELAGVDRLVHFSQDIFNSYCPELQLQALLAVEAQLKPDYWLFPDSIHQGRELGSRFAAKTGQRPALQVWQVDNVHAISRIRHSTQDCQRVTPRLLLLAEECADQIDETRHQALPLAIADFSVSQTSQLQDLGLVDVDPAQISLAEAEFILSGGNGVSDWQQFHQLSALLGATEGASRVAVDDGFMPRFRQVGATGTWVTARVYIAVGISGAIQHLQGMGQVEKVIAINTDAGCDMVKRADLSLIGDSQEILGQLAMQLAEARQQRVEDDTTA